eukprot:CAMPEP_0116947644 /NCGR_PEP_ID=MMETSP0467-20121206/37799_1 /TAXON_ID=283647 /ORGANISM="Mesodinium pulex, Strain SPMC105" /LENGTH=62 /DNA_ID=CAMNT_0004631843 /DNA_START=1289 /DNA_END=1477 /DNA_ORIENTATION=-
MEDLEFFNLRVDKGLLERLEKLATEEFTVITYTEAVKVIKASKKKFENKCEWGCDLASEHEK